MAHQSASSFSPNYDTFNKDNGALRLDRRIAADINYLRSLQEHYDMVEGSSFCSLTIDPEVEHHFRQRWKIE